MSESRTFLGESLRPLTWPSAFYAVGFALFAAVVIGCVIALTGGDWREARSFLPALAMGTLAQEAGITIRTPLAFVVVIFVGTVLAGVFRALL